jgi:peptidoglycan biosynthesis protein MviN/MurJ (putative lipid II flippase)
MFDFPPFIQYVYHIAAFLGLGEIWINYAFAFSEETRFFVCLGYLLIGLANIIFLNWYIGVRDKKIHWTTSFFGSITIPSVLISVVAASCYVNKAPIELPWLPMIPFQVIAATLVVCGIIVGLSMFLPSIGFQHSNQKSPQKPTKRKGGDKTNENRR